MKLSALMLGLLVCASSFAAEINGLNISNLPTASESFLVKAYDDSEVPAAEAKVKASCEAKKVKAEAFARSNGFKILSSKGCELVSKTGYLNDQGPSDGIHVSTSFEVVFR